jgi:hypothetical protein
MQCRGINQQQLRRRSQAKIRRFAPFLRPNGMQQSPRVIENPARSNRPALPARAIESPFV